VHVEKSLPPAVGADGMRGGWVAALVVAAAGGAVTIRWWVLPTIAVLLRAVEDAPGAVLALDMPMGLPDRGPRQCDRDARVRLGAARASVFPAPARGVLADHRAGLDHAEAVRRAHQRGEDGPSVQLWNILGKIGEVDAWLTPHRQAQVLECHPELSLRALDDRVGAPKRTPLGRAQRRDALRCWLDVDRALADLPRGVPEVDALDALACAWTALRVQRGEAEVLGDTEARDPRGLRMLVHV